MDNKNLEFNFSWEVFFAGCSKRDKCQDCQRMCDIQMSSEFNGEGVVMNFKKLMQHCYYIVGKAECYKSWKESIGGLVCPNSEKLIQLWKNNTLRHANQNGSLFERWILETNLKQNYRL